MPLATILGIDERTKISFFKKGLNGELKKALSDQITLPDIFDEFVQACIKIDNERVRYSTALPHLLLFIIFLISHVYYICYFLLSMYGHQDNAGTLSHVIFC